MAKPIDLTQHEKLRRQVTGAPDPSAGRVAPAAIAAEQHVGPPLPIGQAVRVSGSGARELPPEMLAEEMAQMRMDADLNIPLPVPADTPPLQMPKPVPISELDKEQQADYQRTLAAARAGQTIPAQARAQAAAAARARPVDLGAFRVGKPEPVQPQGPAILEIENDLATPAVSPQPAQPAQPQPAQPQPAKDAARDTMPGPTLTHCPHCEWDLSLPSIPEPADTDKMAFLHAILGQKPFSKRYSLLGDNLAITLRTLTVAELDVIHAHVLAEKDKGNVATVEDFWEEITRYRMFVQLLSIHSATDAGISAELPDGLTQATNPGATAYWGFPEGSVIGPTQRPDLKLINDYMLEKVVNTESLMRIAMNTSRQFNRIVAKLEALVDNSDFWKPTGELS